MKSRYILYLISIIIFGCTSVKVITEKQAIKANYQEVVGDTTGVKTIPDKYAMYPDGLKGIYRHIANEIMYPISARKNGIEGTVKVRYVVETDGTIKETEVIQSISPELDNEAIRIILNMKKWIPGYLNGKKVRVEYRQPFVFRLE